MNGKTKYEIPTEACNGVLKKEGNSDTWMNCDSMLNEISQTPNDKCYMNPFICGT